MGCYLTATSSLSCTCTESFDIYNNNNNLKLEYPDYDIDQITLVLDVFGGYSQHLYENIKKIIVEKKEVENIIRNMQKTVIKCEAHLVKVFKLKTM